MKKARALVLVLGITIVVSALPRPAAADERGIDMGQVGKWALVGGIVGGLIGLVAALSRPKPPKVAATPARTASWTALHFVPMPARETSMAAEAESGWSRRALLTF